MYKDVNKKWIFRAFLLGALFCGLQTSQAAFFNPTEAFPSTSNALLPSDSWLTNTKPYPTNAWFINFTLNKSPDSPTYPVNLLPYLMQLSKEGMMVSYSNPIYYAEPNYPAITSAFYYQFENQFTLGAVEPMTGFGVDSYHGLMVTLAWTNAQQQKIIAPVLQGSPYLSAFFYTATPKFSSRFSMKSVNQQSLRGVLPQATRFELVLALSPSDTQTWILYSEKPLQLKWETTPSGEVLAATAPYSGWLRIILQRDSRTQLENNKALIDRYSQTIPLDYEQQYDNTHYSFTWKTQNQQPPLMLSLPHQRKQTVPGADSLRYFGVKGLMLGETTARWDIDLPEIPLVFLEQKNPTQAQKDLLLQALKADADTLLTFPFPDDGPYQVGKRYGRAARLILIADALKAFDLKKRMLSLLKMQLSKKMRGVSSWSFQYDTTWGGIIPSLDVYGARHYTDHHFHYGYWVYTFAVIAHFDADWLTQRVKNRAFTPKQWINGLIRDYANEEKNDPYFPLQRYQDDYAGHSWASGLTAFIDGQNQQSSSEAVNAYYALALFAEASQDNALLRWAKFLMTRELVSAQTYWQIPKNNTVYSEKFKENNWVVANLWGSKIDSNAFFINCQTEYRCGLAYSFGIEMVPFTAISSYLFNKNWLLDAAPTIKKLINKEYGTLPTAWQWILVKGIAPVLTKTDQALFLKQAIESKPEEYDNGDSKTNTLYFLINE
ncbi:MAG: glycosyl hydrolase [Tatlockia sp.]|jgi:endo-1,3(4)-beta-glucanase